MSSQIKDDDNYQQLKTKESFQKGETEEDYNSSSFVLRMSIFLYFLTIGGLFYLQSSQNLIFKKQIKDLQLVKFSGGNPDVKDFQDQIDDLSAYYNELKTNQTSLKEDVSNLKISIQDFTNLKEDVTNIKQTIQDFSSLKQDVSDIKQSIQDFTSLKEDVSNIKISIQDLTALKEEVSNIKLSIQDFQQQLQLIKAQIDGKNDSDIKNNVDSMMTQLKTIQDQLQLQTDTNQNQIQQIQSLQGDILSVNQTDASLSQKQLDQSSLFQGLQSQIQDLEQKQQQQQKDLESNTNIDSTQSEDITTMKGDIQSLNSSQQTLRDDQQSQNSQLETVKSQVQSIQSSISQSNNAATSSSSTSTSQQSQDDQQSQTQTQDQNQQASTSNEQQTTDEAASTLFLNNEYAGISSSYGRLSINQQKDLTLLKKINEQIIKLQSQKY